MKLLQALTVAALATCGVSACGGGGSDGAMQQPVPISTITVLEAANAMAVAGAAAEAALESDDLGGIAEFTGVTVAVPGTVSKSGSMVVTGKFTQGGIGGVISFIPFGPETLPCDVRGTVTVSGDLADPTTLSITDVIRIDADLCEDIAGQVIDGMLELTITNIDGDILNSSLVLLSVDLVVTEFSVTESGETMVANGDIGTTVDNRTPPVIEGSVFGDRISVSGMGTTETLSNFLTVYTEDTSTFPVMWTTNAQGTVESSDFTGEVTYATPLTFEGLGENYPYAGELLVTGANGGTLLLITVNDQQVIIEADYDGDGELDDTIETTWVALEE